jgi:peroxiredoxin
MQRLLTTRILLIVAAIATAVAPAVAQGAPRVEPATFGELFPAATYGNLNPGVGAARIDLADVLGKKPVVLYYFIPKNLRSEEMFAEVQDLVEQAGQGKVALYGVTALKSGQDPAPSTERIQELGISVPVLMDADFRLGQILQVQSVPSITMIDAEGHLRLTNAASPKQDLEYKMNVADGLRRLATTGSIGTYGALPRYDPAVELVGSAAPDFVAPGTDGVVRKWSTLVDPRKLNVLIYWSVECPHCRKTLPEINAWVVKNGDGINIVSVAKAESEAVKIRTREFTNLYQMAFPTLLDVDSKIFDAYQVSATPTLFVVTPDGVVESLLSANGDFGEQMTAKVKDLLPVKSGR